MAKQLGLSVFCASCAVALAVCLSASTAEAGFVQQLQGLQLSNGATHLWGWEGQSAAQRQRDKSGALGHSNLIAVAGPGGSGTIDPDGVPMSGDEINWSYPAGDVNNIQYVPGYDGAGPMGSQAVRPSRTANATSGNTAERVAQSRSAAAFYDPAFTTPSMMTVEAVLQPHAYLDTAGGNFFQYVLQQRLNNGARGYFLGQQRPTLVRGDGSLASVVGGGILADGTRPTAVANYEDSPNLSGNFDWYYVAITFDMSVAAGPTVVNSWSANLSDGGALTQTVVNNINSTGNVSTLVGVGGVAGVLGFLTGDLDAVTPGFQPGIQEVFNGLIDNLTVYGHKLTPEQIGRHYAALTTPGVPEPASAVLLVCGGLAIAALRRRTVG